MPRRSSRQRGIRLDLGTDSFVVEVASNDGYLLQHAVARGIRCLGIEPSVNVGAAARERGVPTETAFLDEQLAQRFATSTARQISLSPTTSMPTSRTCWASPGRCAHCCADDGWLSIEVHHALNLVEPRPVRLDLSRAFPVLHSAFGDSCVGDRRPRRRRRRTGPTHTADRSGYGRASATAGPPSRRVDDVFGSKRPPGFTTSPVTRSCAADRIHPARTAALPA